MKILVINSGSSSIKFQLIEMPSEKLISKGQVEKIGENFSIISMKNLLSGQDISVEYPIPDHERALEKIVHLLMDKPNNVIEGKDEIGAIGHRIVHGGEYCPNSVVIDQRVKQVIDELSLLAPLHNPPNLLGVTSCESIFPDATQVGVFDTSFHLTMPEFASMYAIPLKFYTKYKLKRYGFHGTSHRFVSSEAARFLDEDYSKLNIITCHLGNGCSMAAIKNGVSVDTSMGFTPLEGLIMGTRSGDLDPSLVTFLMDKENLSTKDISNLLNKKSGILGVSALSNDMRILESEMLKGNKEATLAIKMYCYRIKKYLCSYMGVLSQPHVIVFTGGVGENSSIIRKMVLNDLEFFGIKLDEKKNGETIKGAGVISSDDSRVKILAVRTNEELLIARDTFEIVRNLKDRS